MAASKPRGRAQRRAAERAEAKLARARERLADLEVGGSPGRPIEVESASQVETDARARPCTRCGAEGHVAEHTAETIDGARLRLARMRCPRCGAERVYYYRLGSALPN